MLTNNYSLPSPIYDAIANELYDAGTSDISVTSLIDAPQLVELKRQHREEITEDASDRVWSLLGQAMHTVLERSGQGGISEERLYIDVNGWKVSGQFDYIDEYGIMWDWKVVSVFEVMNGIKPEREKQLNCYAHMARLNGYTVNGLRIGFLFRDWKRSDATSMGYPSAQAMAYPVNMWSEERAAAYVEERVKLHQAARNAETLPECTDEERWAKPAKWAVMREGQSRASRLLETEEEAGRWLNAKGWTDGYIEFRDGASVRCESWCPVRRYCQQYNNN